GYTGPDSFQFAVTDTTTNLTSAAAAVTLTMGVPPTANPQSVTTGQGQAKSVTLTGSAPNGDTFTFAVTANPAHGTLSGLNAATGHATTPPPGGYTGSDSFQFTVTDAVTNLASSPAAVSVAVVGPPTADPLTRTVGAGHGTALTLTGSAGNGDA